MVKESYTPAGNNLTVIIVAAGRGTRFGSPTPKQFLPLRGKPVVVHALEAFSTVFPGAKLILVLDPVDGERYWNDAVSTYHGKEPLIVHGGASRTESVYNALKTAAQQGFENGDIVMIHDGARPIVNHDMIRRLYGVVANNPNTHAALPCYLPTEAVGVFEDGKLKPVARSGYRSVQTPQTFDAVILVDCYERMMNDHAAEFDDDAAVFSKYSGYSISCIDGDRNNIKITRPDDIRIAEILSDAIHRQV